MMKARAAAPVAVPLLLGALELAHPASYDSAAWVPIHLGLLIGYGLLIWSLWPPAVFPRVILSVFAGLNTAYVALDGVVVGVLAQSNPAAAQAVWNAPILSVLAALVGATWCAALLALGSTRAPRSTVLSAALALTWLTFIASASASGAGLATRLIPLATAAAVVYTHGTGGLPIALLVLAAVTRQHVGPEAALGMLFIALAGASELSRGRSAPAASSPPGSD